MPSHQSDSPQLRFGTQSLSPSYDSRLVRSERQISSSQISIVLRLEDSTARSNLSETLDSLRKINSWGNESERNRLCIVSAGAAAVLVTAFDGFAVGVLEQLLALISWMLPIIDAEALGRLGSPESVKALV